MSNRGGRRVNTVVVSVLTVLVIAVGIPLNVVSGFFPPVVARDRMLWTVVLGGAALVVVALTLLSRRLDDHASRPALAGQVPIAHGWVNRAELGELIAALTTRGNEPVALTTGLVGAGGFGKTMLAAKACQQRNVLRRFRRGIVWVTVGRDTDGAALAAQISETVRNLGGEGPAFTSLEQAGQALASALQARRGRMLLVADDVWTAEQLAPFAAAGQVARLLVTTRRPRVLDAIGAHRIKVDAVPITVARRMLRQGELPPIMAALELELLELAGGWPLLLGLINRRLSADLRAGGSIGVAAADAVRRLRREGPRAVAVTDDKSREGAVDATIEYSLDILSDNDRDRFRELGVLAEDAEVPLAVVSLLWRGTAGFTQDQALELCDRLDDLSLLSLTWAGQVRVFIMHDEVRDYARRRLGNDLAAAAHVALVNESRSLSRAHKPVGISDSHDNRQSGDVGWWLLPGGFEYGYLWQYLTYHLKAAGMLVELDRVCADLRFISIRLQRSGPAAVEADLMHSTSPIATLLRRLVAQNAHLLGPVEPAKALITTLTSRIGQISEAASQLPALRMGLNAWTAQPDWPLPDVPSDSLLRTLVGHKDWINAVAISPDGTWLATASSDNTVRTWNTDGSPRTIFSGHSDSVNDVAISPDGTWLATASSDNTVRTWNTDGSPRTIFSGHKDWVNSVAIASDGTWLASTGDDGTVRMWTANGNPRATLTGHLGPGRAVAIAPDGTWLASAGSDNTVRIWNSDGNPLATLTGHSDWVRGVAIAPDGTWFASVSSDNTVRIWSANGDPRATLNAHNHHVRAVAIAADGTWLATGSRDQTVRRWTADGSLGATFKGHIDWVNGVKIAPDGTWLASVSRDRQVKIWAAADPGQDVNLVWHRGWVHGMAIAPDGNWLVSGSDDGTVRTWGADGTPRGIIASGLGPVYCVAIAPDESLLAVASQNSGVQILNLDGNLRATLGRRTLGKTAVVIAPDADWLATVSSRGLRTWDPDGQRLATFNEDAGIGISNAAAIAPDGTWLAVANGQGIVQIWGADGSLRATFTAHTEAVNAVAIAPNSTWLATASSDGTVRIWTTQAPNDTGHTAIRIEGNAFSCAWFPQSSAVCVAGTTGLYRFSLCSPFE